MRKSVLLAIAAAIVVSCLFPPWLHIRSSGNVKVYEPLGWAFLGDPPAKLCVVDTTRLGIEIAVLVFIGVCIIGWKYVFPQTGVKPPPVVKPKEPSRWPAIRCGVTRLLCVLSVLWALLGFFGIVVNGLVNPYPCFQDDLLIWAIWLGGAWAIYAIVFWLAPPVLRWLISGFRDAKSKT